MAARKKAAKGAPVERSEPVAVKSVEEFWSSYTLADGSVLKMKPVVVEVIRLVDQFTAEGDPLYGMKVTMVTTTKSPPRLRKKWK
jgi:hypothetical protein